MLPWPERAPLTVCLQMVRFDNGRLDPLAIVARAGFRRKPHKNDFFHFEKSRTRNALEGLNWSKIWGMHVKVYRLLICFYLSLRVYIC